MNADVIAIGDKASALIVKRTKETGEPEVPLWDRSLGLNYVFAVGMMEYAQESFLETADMFRAAAQTMNWLAILTAAATPPLLRQARPFLAR